MSDTESHRTCSEYSDEVRLQSFHEEDYDSNEKEDHPKYQEGYIFKVDFRRFYMLTLYSFLNITNQMCWISLVSVDDNIIKAYELNDNTLNLIANLYPIMFLPGVTLAIIVYSKQNLRIGLIIGSIIMAVGASLKCFINHSIEIFFIGQAICGFSQALFIIAPAMLATQWFEDSKRRHAITIGGTAIAVGIIVGLVLPTIFIDDPYIKIIFIILN